MGEYILRLIALVPVVGGLAWGSLWMWKKLQLGMPAQGGNNTSRSLRIVEVLPLGLGSKLAVVEFQGRELLVSVSKTDVRLIADSHD